MSGSWLRRGRADEDDVDDEPMPMLDLSAYEVPPERRGAFRAAIAAGSDHAGPEHLPESPAPPA